MKPEDSKLERHCAIQIASSVLLMISLSVFAPATIAIAEQLPKEGTFAVTMVVDQTTAEMPIAAKRSAYTYDAQIVYINDAGSSFLDKVVGRCFGTGYNPNAEGGNRSVGECLLRDADGDTILVKTESGRASRADKQPGVATFVEGTGKYTGIEGKYEYAWEWLKATPEGARDHGISHSKGSYKIAGGGSQ